VKLLYMDLVWYRPLMCPSFTFRNCGAQARYTAPSDGNWFWSGWR